MRLDVGNKSNNDIRITVEQSDPVNPVGQAQVYVLPSALGMQIPLPHTKEDPAQTLNHNGKTLSLKGKHSE